MRRIPVVNDDLHVGRTMRIWLEPHGVRVSTADGGPNGLAAPDNGTFDLMIVDVFMPRIARLRIDPAVSRTCTDGAVDRDLRCSKPMTPLNVIDEYLFEAEPHLGQAVTPGAVAEAVRKSQAKRKSAGIVAVSSEARRADRAGGGA